MVPPGARAPGVPGLLPERRLEYRARRRPGALLVSGNVWGALPSPDPTGLDPESAPRRHTIDPKTTPNRPNFGPESALNQPRMDPPWTKIGPTSPRHRPNIDPESTPDRPRNGPNIGAESIPNRPDIRAGTTAKRPGIDPQLTPNPSRIQPRVTPNRPRNKGRRTIRLVDVYYNLLAERSWGPYAPPSYNFRNSNNTFVDVQSRGGEGARFVSARHGGRANSRLSRTRTKNMKRSLLVSFGQGRCLASCRLHKHPGHNGLSELPRDAPPTRVARSLVGTGWNFIIIAKLLRKRRSRGPDVPRRPAEAGV